MRDNARRPFVGSFESLYTDLSISAASPRDDHLTSDFESESYRHGRHTHLPPHPHDLKDLSVSKDPKHVTDPKDPKNLKDLKDLKDPKDPEHANKTQRVYKATQSTAPMPIASPNSVSTTSGSAHSLEAKAPTRSPTMSPTIGMSCKHSTTESARGVRFDAHGDSSARPVATELAFYHYGIEWAHGTTTARVAKLNILNVVIGVGLFDLADAFQGTGIPLGCIFLTISAVATAYALHLLHKLSVITKQLSYGQIALKIKGPYPCLVVDSLIALEMCLFTCSFLSLLDSLLDDDLNDFESSASRSIFSKEGFPFVAFLCGIGALALCNISKISTIKISAVFAAVYILALLLMTMVQSRQLSGDTLEQFAKQSPKIETLEAVPIIIFALNCNLQFMPIYNELPQPVSDGVAESLIKVPLYISYGLYLLLGILGSALSDGGNGIEELLAGRISLVAALIIKYPIMAHAGFKSIQFLVRIYQTPGYIDYLQELQESDSMIINASPPSKWLLFTSSAFVIITAVASVALSSLAKKVINIVGILITIMLSFILPPYLYMSTFHHITLWEKRYPLMLLCFGALVFVLSIVGSIVNA